MSEHKSLSDTEFDIDLVSRRVMELQERSAGLHWMECGNGVGATKRVDVHRSKLTQQCCRRGETLQRRVEAFSAVKKMDQQKWDWKEFTLRTSLSRMALIDCFSVLTFDFSLSQNATESVDRWIICSDRELIKGHRTAAYTGRGRELFGKARKRSELPDVARGKKKDHFRRWLQIGLRRE